jgi:hypothetical protein
VFFGGATLLATDTSIEGGDDWYSALSPPPSPWYGDASIPLCLLGLVLEYLG